MLKGETQDGMICREHTHTLSLRKCFPCLILRGLKIYTKLSFGLLFEHLMVDGLIVQLSGGGFLSAGYAFTFATQLRGTDVGESMSEEAFVEFFSCFI